MSSSQQYGIGFHLGQTNDELLKPQDFNFPHNGNVWIICLIWKTNYHVYKYRLC